MKLKQIPSDFIVEEINSFNFLPSGTYSIFLLEKQTLDTFGAILLLSKLTNIPQNEFGYAGLKDKHAKTFQYFSIPSTFAAKINETKIAQINIEKNIKIKFMGFLNNPITVGDLEDNRFTITVRGIDKELLPKILPRIENIKLNGVPNYFDSQRFGSLTGTDFIGKLLITGDYEKAVKIYVTEYTKSDSSDLKSQKKYLLANWAHIQNKDFSKIDLKIIKENIFKKIISELSTTKSWLSAYKQIPYNIRELHLSAYQSFIWNECVKSLFFKYVEKKNIYSVQYAAGTLIYFKTLSTNERKRFPEEYPLISHDSKLSVPENAILDKILKYQEITLANFNVAKNLETHFKTYSRKIFLHPQKLEYKVELDEINDKGRNSVNKIIFSFTLGKGSYATVVLKGIFNR